jgi:DNA-binding GntR family transcriptional regulator
MILFAHGGIRMEKKYSTKREKVYFNVQNEIIKGVIRPGTRLIISQLAKRFDVSEAPVREALQMLAHEGFASLTPHSGAIVSSLSEDDIRQIFEVRTSLETLACRLAVDHLTNLHIKSLEMMLENSDGFLRQQDLQGYREFNRSFHEFIYQQCNNQRLILMINELWDFSTRYPAFSSLQDVETSSHEHREIVDALKERNADLAGELIKQHTMRSYREIIRLVQQNQLNPLDE